LPETRARRVEWTRRALRGLFDAWAFIALDNLAAADTVETRIRTAAARLGTHPFLGRVGRLAGSRELPVARTSYTLIYRVRRNRVQILRVLHQRRRFP
jgi:plasmid stabilization system protein ParE